MRDTAYKALVAKEKLMQNTDREPTIDEIAKEIGATYKAVYFALTATSNTISLDEPIGDEGKEMTMMDRTSFSVAPDNDAWMENLMLRRAIDDLNAREKEILVMRYFHGKTQTEVSDEIGISQAQVSRLEKNALADLRKLKIEG